MMTELKGAYQGSCLPERVGEQATTHGKAPSMEVMEREK